MADQSGNIPGAGVRHSFLLAFNEVKKGGTWQAACRRKIEK